MKPKFSANGVEIYHGDCREVLRALPDESVHCVVTSPPYWGLRDYGTASWQGGDSSCEHRSPTMREGRNEDRAMLSGSAATNSAQLLLAARTGCGKCGATRIDRQIGIEDSPIKYISTMREVFAEVRRVLRSDGTLWLNMGDSYASGDRSTYRSGASENKGQDVQNDMPRPRTPNGLKAKDLVGVPWMLAFALREDGWYLRQDIIWAKPNPMPESVTDRCTKSHEYLFLLSKSERYYYNADAIKEPAAWERWGDQTVVKEQQGTASWIGNKTKAELTGRTGKSAFRGQGSNRENGNGHANRDGRAMKDIGADLVRNKRSVWEVTTQPFPEAHFATFPEDLIKPCILAGCVEGGTVLDPFMGSGTTGLVARKLHCKAIGIELNEEYIEIASRRLSQEVFNFAQ